MAERSEHLDAASRRSAGEQYRAPADRPSQRRCAEQPGALAVARARLTHVELRQADDGGPLDYIGYASATNAPYEMWDWAGPYTEIVNPGAFGATLGQTDLDVPLVLGHDSMRRLARTTNGSLTLAEILNADDDPLGLGLTGLLTRAPALDPADADVAYIAPKLRSGLIDEMSFRFTITSGQWSPDWMEYHINAVDIHRGDVSIVGYGANPTTVATLRAPLSDDEIRDQLRTLQAEAAQRGLTAGMRLHDLMKIA